MFYDQSQIHRSLDTGVFIFVGFVAKLWNEARKVHVAEHGPTYHIVDCDVSSR